MPMAADTKTKRKKKRWISIVGNKPFENKDLGESYVADAESLVGRNLKLNLMTVLGNPRKQNINIGFTITEAKENKGHATVNGFEMISSTLKRFVRRNKDKVEDSFLAKTKSGKLLRIKPLIITQANTYKSEQTRLRLTAREQIRDYTSKNEFEAIVQDLIDGKLQKTLKENLSKLYPLRAAEIRSAKIVEVEKSE